MLTEVILTVHAQPPWADPSGGTVTRSVSLDQQATPQQRQQHQFEYMQQSQNYRSLPGTPAARQVMLEDVTSPNAGGIGPPGGGGLGADTNFLFPQPVTKSRSKSDTSLEPPNWDTSTTATFVNQSANNSAVDDGASPGCGTVNMQEVQGQGPPYTSPPSTGHSLQGFNFPNSPSNSNGFLTPAPGPIRRAKSDSIGRHRQTHSDDIRSLALLSQPGNLDASSMYYNRQGSAPNSAPAPSSSPGYLSPPQTHVSRFLSPSLESSSVPIRFHRSTRSLSSTSHLTPDYPHASGPGPIRRSPSSTRSERGSVWSDASSPGGGVGGPGSNRVSPYPSPKASPRPGLGDLPGPGTYDDIVGTGVGRVSGWMGAGNQHLSVQQQQQQHVNGAGNMFGLDSPPLGMMPRMTANMSGPGQNHTGFLGAVGFSGLESSVSVSPGRARNVRKSNVTTERTRKASVNRRKADAPFVCSVPGCGSTFTRSFNLKGEHDFLVED